MMSEVMFSSKRKDWETPKELFDELDREFHFTLDPASTDENALCKKHFTRVKTDYCKAGRVKQCIAILHTGVNFRCGLKRPQRKPRRVQPWLC